MGDHSFFENTIPSICSHYCTYVELPEGKAYIRAVIFLRAKLYVNSIRELEENNIRISCRIFVRIQGVIKGA